MISKLEDRFCAFQKGKDFVNSLVPFFRIRPVVMLLPLFCSAGFASAADMEITSFSSFNQGPLVQIYGLPHDTTAGIIPRNKLSLALNQDYTSNYTVHSTSREQITLDGETYRLALVTRYGIAPRMEIGLEIPYVSQKGGFLDNFIVDWHNTFKMPQGGRDNAPDNQLHYGYRKDGVQKLQMNQGDSGLGDVSLTGGLSLYDVSGAERHDRLAFKGAVKLPTGDSSSLLGSGSTDLMLQFCGSMNRYTEWGSLGLYGSVGGLAMSKSDVLRDQHNQLAGFGSLGLGWGPASWISFKVQLNGTTSLYRDSSLHEIATSTVASVFGGALRFPGGYLLDIGVAEDIKLRTAPDVSFHLGLSKQY